VYSSPSNKTTISFGDPLLQNVHLQQFAGLIGWPDGVAVIVLLNVTRQHIVHGVFRPTKTPDALKFSVSVSMHDCDCVVPV
jgi:hypothetical protein